MTLRRWMMPGFGTGMIVVFAILAHSAGVAPEKKPRDDDDSPFAGQVVLIYEKNVASKAGVGFVFKNARLTQIKGVPFVAGRCLEERGDALAGVNASIPLDNIGSIVEFDDVESYKKFAAKLTQPVE